MNTMRRYSVHLLLIIMFFFGCLLCSVLAQGSEKFLGDEAYLKYPHSFFRLRKERVIVRIDEHDQIEKVYWYNTFGALRRIHLPQDNITLFINKYGANGKYIFAEGTHIFSIVGGTFDHFSTRYRGGAGLADMAIAQAYLRTIIESTKKSLHHLEESIRRYETQAGIMLTEEQFQERPSAVHPLMNIKGMNVAYFFDGRGHRINFERTPGGFHLSSATFARDQQAYEHMEERQREWSANGRRRA